LAAFDVSGAQLSGSQSKDYQYAGHSQGHVLQGVGQTYLDIHPVDAVPDELSKLPQNRG